MTPAIRRGSFYLPRAIRKGEEEMENVLFVGIGGFMGTSLRFILGRLLVWENLNLPLTTFLINVAGSFIIGVLNAAAIKYGMKDHAALLLLQVGFCGGFTTFSTFSLETLDLLSHGEVTRGVLYASLSVVTCVCCAALGRFIAQVAMD